MSFPPTGVIWYPLYSVEEYLDIFGQAARHFKIDIYESGTLQNDVGYNDQMNAFQAMDQDADGYISLSEWRSWMAVARTGSSTPSLTTTDYDTMFAALDIGDPHAGNYGAYDGKLAFVEMQYMFGVWIDF
jgi:hypothetical protein